MRGWGGSGRPDSAARCPGRSSTALSACTDPGASTSGRIRGNTIGAPGFEPGTSATRTQRSTGLSHAPKPDHYHSARIRASTCCPARLEPRRALLRRSPWVRISISTAHSNGRGGMSSLRSRVAGSPLGAHPRVNLLPRSARTTPRSSSKITVGSNLYLHCSFKRTGWDSNPRGREPTRFPIVRLKPLGHPSSKLGTSPPDAYASDGSVRYPARLDPRRALLRRSPWVRTLRPVRS